MNPKCCAGTNPTRKEWVWILSLQILLFAFLFNQTNTSTILSIILSFMMCLWIGFRCLALFNKSPLEKPAPIPKFEDLPVYTVLVPLYKEANIVADLSLYLNQLIWPKEKLQIFFLVEQADEDTQVAITNLNLPSHFEMLIVPPGQPKTKPKALNLGLLFAKGEYIVIYDAEDRPQPDQLIKAYQSFQREGAQLGCLQASLAIDNANESWLSGHFALEYDVLFSKLLPGFASMGLPLPLGGTSNHFPTKLLRNIGGWDAWNVTEDADLGLRIHRNGFQIKSLASSTFEEAPIHLGNWVPQRTRWLKGWIQTYIVHMRNPIQLYHQAKLKGFLAIQSFVIGGVLAPLLYPIALAVLVSQIYKNTLFVPSEDLLKNISISMQIFVLNLGLLSGFLPLLKASQRLKMHALSAIKFIITAPVYWLLISFCAWRALLQFVYAPYSWEKTKHGVSIHRL